jgi:DNA-binding beta-propeller fold protein YncE
MFHSRAWTAVLGFLFVSACATHKPNQERALALESPEKAPSSASKKERKKPKRIAIGTNSVPRRAQVRLKLVARFQSIQKKPKNQRDIYDTEVYSPKSVHFASRGQKVYVNSLEGNRTVIYDARKLKKVGSIHHKFTDNDKKLFLEDTVSDYQFDSTKTGGSPNIFTGKPVELELSHQSQFLWVPYYRRSYDENGTNPSAVAIVDTRKDRIVRVMPTGPISKYVLSSPDEKYMAISNWGDNSLTLIDVSDPDPAKFTYAAHLIVENSLDLKGLENKEINRDKACGFCLRGLAYSKDGRYLFVARMGGDGGIAVFDLRAEGGPRYLGAISGMSPRPRDLLVSSSGDWLYLSSTMTGYISRIPVSKVIEAAIALDAASPRQKMMSLQGFQEVKVGIGPRTIRFSPDEKYLFVAVNDESKLVVVDLESMKVVSNVKTDPFPVGLALSPDGKQAWVTAQGHSGYGGNSVMIYRVSYRR